MDTGRPRVMRARRPGRIWRPDVTGLPAPNGDDDESRSDESFQPADPGAGLRPDPDLDREPGQDSLVVLRRDQEAGDDQLSDLQARSRRPGLPPPRRADHG